MLLLLKPYSYDDPSLFLSLICSLCSVPSSFYHPPLPLSLSLSLFLSLSLSMSIYLSIYISLSLSLVSLSLFSSLFLPPFVPLSPFLSLSLSPYPPSFIHILFYPVPLKVILNNCIALVFVVFLLSSVCISIMLSTTISNTAGVLIEGNKFDK